MSRVTSAGALAVCLALCALGGCAPREFQTYAVAIGRVVVYGTDPAEPVADAVVVLSGLQTRTDAEGGFRFDDIPVESMNTYLTVSRDGYRTIDEGLNLQSAGDLVVALHAVADELQAGTINGQLTNSSTDEPLAQIPVTATVERLGTVVDQQTAHTSSEGKFQISGIPVGETSVTATLEGYIPAKQVVTVLPGQGSNRFINLKLTPGTARVPVRGTVVDVKTREPLAGVLVAVDESTDTATTDSAGAFTLSSVLVGVRTFSATLQGYDPAYVSALILAESDPIQIQMSSISEDPPPTAYNIGGNVTVEGLASAAGVTVVVTPVGASSPAARYIIERGTWYGVLVPAGDYVVRASLPGFDAAEVTVSILPGEVRRDVDLTLVHGT